MGKKILPEAFCVSGKGAFVNAKYYETDVSENYFIGSFFRAFFGSCDQTSFFTKGYLWVFSNNTAVCFPHTSAFLRGKLTYCWNSQAKIVTSSSGKSGLHQASVSAAIFSMLLGSESPFVWESNSINRF